ncbi:hypothetical protein Pmani_005201 [Petrolisthes manimaculis]|uniref:C2H2-type domain-containing protein n=1 Tax=Petrolisthes manimaculis TaxID=1843537 RepID=A0AAE1UN75_9EUCA|nr:hypothetical protein Pmani_005201 [Petrolisthes manimaculis]
MWLSEVILTIRIRKLWPNNRLTPVNCFSPVGVVNHQRQVCVRVRVQRQEHGVELPNAACHKQHEGLKMATVLPVILPPPSAPFPVRRSIVQLGQESNRREYWCRVCGYQAISESKLIIHFRKHTGEKPFVCSYCSYRCAHKSNLITHVKTRHADQEFHKQ